MSIARRRTVKEGKNKGKDVLSSSERYYYNNFTQALEGLIDRDIQSLEKLEEIEGRIAELKADLRIMLKEVGKT